MVHVIGNIVTFSALSVEVRELNMYREGDRTFYGQSLVDCTLPRCWSDVIKQSDYENRKQRVHDFNRYRPSSLYKFATIKYNRSAFSCSA